MAERRVGVQTAVEAHVGVGSDCDWSGHDDEAGVMRMKGVLRYSDSVGDMVGEGVLGSISMYERCCLFQTRLNGQTPGSVGNCRLRR